MTSTTHITVGIAFLAGLVSFVSPCVLPLVPAYLSLLTGESLEELKAESAPAARAQTLAARARVRRWDSASVFVVARLDGERRSAACSTRIAR